MAEASPEILLKKIFFVLLFIVVVLKMAAIKPCNTSNRIGRPCKLCTDKHLDTNPEFYSVCANKSYRVDFNATCTTSMCIYLVTCKQCSLRYIGKTINSIRDRLNGHRNNIIAKTEAKIMLHHFTI